MKYTLILILTNMLLNSGLLIDFNLQSDLQGWKVVDDIVMGGKSSSTFSLSAEGHGQFSGAVSLDNNGGFSSVRYPFDKIDVTPYTKVTIKLRGDGKNYQFRIKANSSDAYSYISTFSTSGEWQQVEILLDELIPSFRGRRLEKNNFKNTSIEEIGFLISNKQAENFNLLIDRIAFK